MRLWGWIKNKLTGECYCAKCAALIPFGKSAWLMNLGGRFREWVCDTCHKK